MTEIGYVGGELEVFAHAVNWKRYVRSQIEEYLKGSVLEVGAGIGSNTMLYRSGDQRRWVCLEPDPRLAKSITSNPALANCEVMVGTVADLSPEERFDAVLYMDVLEHISDDADELRNSAKHLAPGGRLIVLGPAHQWLFTPFDRAIGHYRRYNAGMLKRVAPSGLTLERLRYLDMAGICASVGNRLILSSDAPTVQQIKVWDRFLVPVSRRLDWLLGYRLGKSVLAVWRMGSTPASSRAPTQE
jgi:SAM-dependent methyltransferase